MKVFTDRATARSCVRCWPESRRTQPAPAARRCGWDAPSDRADFLAMFKSLLTAFSAPQVVAIRKQVDEQSQIVYRPLEAPVLPLPWHRGRVR
ncbi:hypothetical protein [Variovorax sp. PBS-H4]|uniref:hypothetical protein n=1 Tax=Variovorax sp. PBS-H4 TaxID=434008 RepID=UPI0018D9A006|nr:hypothetical protein [Variovorax sp. PBS-H4]